MRINEFIVSLEVKNYNNKFVERIHFLITINTNMRE